jgi:hypothetical protein
MTAPPFGKRSASVSFADRLPVVAGMKWSFVLSSVLSRAHILPVVYAHAMRQSDLLLNLIVLRRSPATILAVIALAGCAENPARLCEPLVPSSFVYLGPDDTLSAIHGADLPQAPYQTNEGKPVRATQRVWYRSGPDALLACTFARHARDTCSVRTTEFIRVGDAWSKGREDGVLCNVVR